MRAYGRYDGWGQGSQTDVKVDIDTSYVKRPYSDVIEKDLQTKPEPLKQEQTKDDPAQD